MLSGMDSGSIAVLAIAVIIGYLIGSIPVANLVARRRGVSDLRAVGDRNPGYWNAKEQLGRRAALPVFIGDTAKGALAAAVGLATAANLGDDRWWIGYLVVGAAMVGHAFPILAHLRGGRSVLTFVGGAIVLAPLPAALAIAVLIATLVISRRFDIAARIGIVCFPVAQIILEGPWRTAATGVLMTFIGIRFAQAALSNTPDRANVGG